MPGNPEDRFSHDTAHIVKWIVKWQVKKGEFVQYFNMTESAQQPYKTDNKFLFNNSPNMKCITYIISLI